MSAAGTEPRARISCRINSNNKDSGVNMGSKNANSSSPFWELLGKTTVVLTLVGLVIGIYQWYATPSTKLSVVIETAEVLNEPTLARFAKKYDSVLSRDTFASEFAPYIKSYADELLLRNKIEEKLKEIRPSQYDAFKRAWKATVKNDGDLALKDVALRLPDASAHQIGFSEDAVVQPMEKDPMIKIGDLAPGQTTELILWSKTEYLTRDDYDNIALYHSQGRGSVEIKNRPNMLFDVLSAPAAYLFLLPVFGLLILGILSAAFQSGAKSERHRIQQGFAEHEKTEAEQTAPKIENL